MKRVLNSRFCFAILVTGGFFAVFLLLCRPILNSDDDFYLLYTLAGGYGAKPTHILHYFLGWHPVLYWPVSTLFALNPNVNWYAFFLLALQVVACTFLLYTLLSAFRRIVAILAFGFFFLFFESALLLSLNNSNTSLLLAIAGCSALLFKLSNGAERKLASLRDFIFPVVLLIISGLLRSHTLGICLFLSAMTGVVLLRAAAWKKLFQLLAIAGVVVAVFYVVQFWYYAAEISDYKKEERFRNAIFKTSNLPLDHESKDTGIAEVKASFIRSLFLYDTNFVNADDIEHYLQRRDRSGPKWASRKVDNLYWLFVNHRVYLLLLCCTIFLFVALRQYSAMRKWILLLITCFLLLSGFYLFLKITAWILIAVLGFLFFAALVLLKETSVRSPLPAFVVVALLTINIGWMVMRTRATAKENAANIAQTHAILNELKAYSQNLFVNTTYFNDRGFTLWDTPAQYPLPNFVNVGNILTNSTEQTFRRFGVDSIMLRLPQRADLFVSGKKIPLLQEYYRRVLGLDVYLEQVQGFRTIDVYRVRVKTPGPISP